MAASDYRLCDVCASKVFYDSNLNYEQGNDVVGSVRNAGQMNEGTKLDYLGDWVVICDDCAKTHECKVVPKSAPQAPLAEAGAVGQWTEGHNDGFRNGYIAALGAVESATKLLFEELPSHSTPEDVENLDAKIERQIDRLSQSIAALPDRDANAEPDAWEFQHEETGLTTVLSNDGVNNAENFARNNPRHQLVGMLWRAPPPPAGLVVDDAMVGRFMSVYWDGYSLDRMGDGDRIRETTSIRAALSAALSVGGA